MSRIRITLDSVSKAVGSTDINSKFSRFKPGNPVVDSDHAEKLLVKAQKVSSTQPDVSLPSKATVEDADGEKCEAEDENKEQAAEKPFKNSKPTNMDETYKTLDQHINSYFGMSSQGEEEERKHDRIPVSSPAAASKSIDALAATPPSGDLRHPKAKPPSDSPATESTAASGPVRPSSPKKGFTHYLSYPRPSVQAFVANYIAPLVPEFRGDAKSLDKLPVVEASVEEAASEDPKADEKFSIKQQANSFGKNHDQSLPKSAIHVIGLALICG